MPKPRIIPAWSLCFLRMRANARGTNNAVSMYGLAWCEKVICQKEKEARRDENKATLLEEEKK
jgi:hypothetical protein